MQHMKSKAELRQERILQLLEQNDSVSIGFFRTTLGCSESTIRNDLAYLEKMGKLRRIFGGAIRVEMEPAEQYFELSDRKRAYLREKTAIARYIIKHMLPAKSVVILDASTTNEVLAQELVKTEIPLTVLTNSLAIANIINQSTFMSLYLFGGYYIRDSGYFYDSLFNSSLSYIRSDIYFMGVNGIRPDGFTCIGRDETSSKLGMMKIASKTIVPADHSKFHQSGLSMVDDYNLARILVTDAGANEKDLATLKASGIEVHLAPLE